MINPAQQTPMINPNAPPVGLTVLMGVVNYLDKLITNVGRVQQKSNAHMNAMISQLQATRRRLRQAMHAICTDHCRDRYSDERSGDDDDAKGGGKKRRRSEMQLMFNKNKHTNISTLMCTIIILTHASTTIFCL